MGNTLLLRPWLLDEATVGTVGSEAGGLIAKNLQDSSPGLVWRASDLGNVYAEFDFGKRARWRYVCPVGGLVTAGPNVIRNSEDLDGTGWTTDGVTVSDDSTQIDPFGDIPSHKLVEDTSSWDHGIKQSHTMRVNALDYFVFSGYYNSEGQNDRCYHGIDFNSPNDAVVAVIFDLSAGASSGDILATDVTGFGVLDSSGSEKLADGWWRVWFVCHLTVVTNIMTTNFLSATGLTRLYVGDGVTPSWVAGPQLEVYKLTSGLPTVPGEYAPTLSGEEGATWRWRGATASADLTSAPVFDSGELLWALNGKDYRSFSHADSFLDCGSVQQLRYGRIDILDAFNLAGQVDLNRLFVDEGINLGSSSPFGSQLPGYQEATIERHRTQSDRLVTRQHVSKKTNSYSLNIQSRETVRKLQEVSRRQGSSRDVVLVHDPSGTHTQEGLVHGVLGPVSPPVLTMENLWKTNISIEEQ